MGLVSWRNHHFFDMTGVNDLHAAYRADQPVLFSEETCRFSDHPAAGIVGVFYLAGLDQLRCQRRNRSSRNASHSSWVLEVG